MHANSRWRDKWINLALHTVLFQWLTHTHKLNAPALYSFMTIFVSEACCVWLCVCVKREKEPAVSLYKSNTSMMHDNWIYTSNGQEDQEVRIERETEKWQREGERERGGCWGLRKSFSSDCVERVESSWLKSPFKYKNTRQLSAHLTHKNTQIHKVYTRIAHTHTLMSKWQPNKPVCQIKWLWKHIIK